MNKVVVDFESYYDKEMSVTTLGLNNYVEKAYAYIVSIVSTDLGIRFCGTIDEAQKLFPVGFFLDKQNQFIGANSNFDSAWVDRYWDASNQGMRPWKCVLDRGAPEQCPGHLKGVVFAQLGVKMDKSQRDDMKGRHWDELALEEQVAMKKYCLLDSELTLKAYESLPDPSTVEDELAEHTRALNRKGIHVDTDTLDEHTTIMKAAQFHALRNIPWFEQGLKPLSSKALAAWCSGRGIPVPESIAKTDEVCTELMTEHPMLNAMITTLRNYRRSNTLIKKMESVTDRIYQAHDGTKIPLEFLYCGARHTRRWSCRGVNIQNLDREPLKLSTALPISDELKKKYLTIDKKTGEQHISIWSRQWLVPPPGKTFLVLDYSQIEPRCLNWLVGNDELLDAVRAGYSVYEAYARTAYGWAGDKGTLKSDYGIAKYTLVKNEVLGLGYGMGATRYCDYAGVDQETAVKTVYHFRKRNPKIVRFWDQLSELIKTTALGSVDSRNRNFAVTMPSGQKLHYFAVAPKSGGHIGYTIKTDYSHASIQERLWGGTLAENVTQRMAREVFAEGLLRVEKAGLPVAFTSHDESILVVDKDNKEEARAEAIHQMTIVPEWCKGLPLAVEGDFCDRYTK